MRTKKAKMFSIEEDETDPRSAGGMGLRRRRRGTYRVGSAKSVCVRTSQSVGARTPNVPRVDCDRRSLLLNR